MTNWKRTIKIKHLFTVDESLESIQKSMTNIADILKAEYCFRYFDHSKFYGIPPDNGICTPVQSTNILLDRLYDYADEYRIWIV